MTINTQTLLAGSNCRMMLTYKGQHMLSEFTINVMQTLAFLLIGVVCAAILIAAMLFVIDRSQRADAIRRNYPVIGRFRHLFSLPGEF